MSVDEFRASVEDRLSPKVVCGGVLELLDELCDCDGWIRPGLSPSAGRAFWPAGPARICTDWLGPDVFSDSVCWVEVVFTVAVSWKSEAWLIWFARVCSVSPAWMVTLVGDWPAIPW